MSNRDVLVGSEIHKLRDESVQCSAEYEVVV